MNNPVQASAFSNALLNELLSPPINKFYLSCWCIKERHSYVDGECPRINQTQKMDLYLIELLRYQVLNGNKVGDGFVVKAWIETVRLFNGKFGLTITKILEA